MRSLEAFLDEYGQNHRHPVNQVIHKVAVPLIVLSILGLLWSASPYLAIGIGLCVLAFYFYLSVAYALGMVVFFGLVCGVIYWLSTAVSTPLWLISAVVFVAAWIIQFMGHAIEGARPSFTKDLVFLLIGPLWVIAPIYGYKR